MGEAVECALRQKDSRFASLVAQAGGHNLAFKRQMQRQLQQWKKQDTMSPSAFGGSAFGAINSYRQHIYHILSGEIEGCVARIFFLF